MPGAGVWSRKSLWPSTGRPEMLNVKVSKVLLLGQCQHSECGLADHQGHLAAGRQGPARLLTLVVSGARRVVNEAAVL